ncbi:DUF1949 domain-containing protein [Clostridium sp.]|uniref:DUF1949 domain-containing protein n=1 Tax=Clostridium sp. TaxID=1506 RepID=UPI00345DB52F
MCFYVCTYGVCRLLLLESDLQKLTLYQIYNLRVPYEWYELLKYHLSQHDWVIKKEDFNESVSLLIHVPSPDAEFFQKWLGDFTRQQVDCVDRGSVWG